MEGVGLEKRGAVCKGEVLEVVMDLMFVPGGQFGLSCEKCLMSVVEKSGVVFSCEEGLGLSAKSGGRAREVEDGAGSCASVVR